MRLIDADLLKQNCKCTGGFNDNFVGVDLITLARVIDNQPTAYDVEKVVEKLECDRCESCSLLEVCAGSMCCGKCREKIIEIVKQGGVFDDVCEWNGEQSRFVTYTNFTTACGYSFDLQMNNELLKAFRYCPFCGKKLKVVERMNRDKAATIAYAIRKECQKDSLYEWCENWDITIDELM